MGGVTGLACCRSQPQPCCGKSQRNRSHRDSYSRVSRPADANIKTSGLLDDDNVGDASDSEKISRQGADQSQNRTGHQVHRGRQLFTGFQWRTQGKIDLQKHQSTFSTCYMLPAIQVAQYSEQDAKIIQSRLARKRLSAKKP